MPDSFSKTEPAEKTKIFAPWVWVPMLVLGAGVLIFLFLIIWEVNALIGLVLVVLALLYFLIQTLGRLALRQWRHAGLALLRLICLVLGLYYFVFPAVGVLVAFNQLNGPSEDHFADNLIIPDGIDIATPMDNIEAASGIGGQDNVALILCNGMQPGIYVAHYKLNPGAPGSVYLKAFEVTQGTPLSVHRLREKSETRMSWSADQEERFNANKEIIIYEGDWGKPYAARFEVWFKPDDGSPQRKLAERIFKIEGWQR